MKAVVLVSGDDGPVRSVEIETAEDGRVWLTVGGLPCCLTSGEALEVGAVLLQAVGVVRHSF